MREIGRRLDGEGELLRDNGRLRFQADPAAVSYVVLPGKRTDGFPERLRLLLAEVRAPPVKPFVAVELLGPVARQVLEEMLSRPRPEVQRGAPEVRCAGISGGGTVTSAGPVAQPVRARAMAHDASALGRISS